MALYGDKSPRREDPHTPRNSPIKLSRTKECNMHHLPEYTLQLRSGWYQFPFTEKSKLKRCRHHIDHASHLMGRNATQDEAQALAEHCELATQYKPITIAAGIILGVHVNEGKEHRTMLGQYKRFLEKDLKQLADLPLRDAMRLVNIAGQNAPPPRPGLIAYAALGWLVGDKLSTMYLGRERQDPRLSSLRACDPRDLAIMSWDATSLWSGEMATGPDSLGFFNRYFGWYAQLGLPR